MSLKRSLLLILSIFISTFLFLGTTNAASTPQYKLYQDGDNVRWKYAYINEDGKEYVEVSFFDAPSETTSVTVPSITSLRAYDSSEITTTVKELRLVNYASQALSGSYSGEYPNSYARKINLINLTNVTNIYGVSPMLNKSVKTTIIFSTNASQIGDAIKSARPSAGESNLGIGVFEGADLTLQNLNHVTSIGVRAFAKTTLTDTDLDLTANLETIKDGAFWGSNVTTVKINTPKIDYNAFRECNNLTKVTLGNDVTWIDSGAFEDSPNLTTINFNNVTKIGNLSFSGCTSLDVDINASKIESIGDGAFMNTTSLKYDISIPKTMTTIGWRTFYNSGITGVKLNNVTKIDTEAFAECQNLSNVDFGQTKFIMYRAFYNDSNLENVTLSDSVIDIQTEAFMDCNISNLDLNKIKKIDTRAFANNNLTELYLPKSLIYVNSPDLFDNNHITKVTIAYDTAVSTITTPFFTLLGSNYKDLTDLILIAPYDEDDPLVDEQVEYTTMRSVHRFNGVSGSHAPSGADDTNPAYGNANNYKNIIQSTYFFGLPALENITIGEGYEFIGTNAFIHAGTTLFDTIKKVELPSTLKGIGRGAFEYCLGYTEDKVDITLPAGLEYIGLNAFYSGAGFQEDLNLENLRYIGDSAFAGSGIGNIYLHDKIEYMSSNSFLQKDIYDYYDENKIGYDHTKEIIIDFDIYSIIPPSYSSQYFYSSLNNNQKYDLIKFTSKAVTEPKVNAANKFDSYMYKVKAKELDLSETPWSSLGIRAFVNAEIDTLKLPHNLKTIEPSTFYGANITNVVDIPDTVEYIKDGAFINANVKINQLPSSLKELAVDAFYNCDFNSDPIIPAETKFVEIDDDIHAVFGSDPDKGIKRNSITFLNNFEESNISIAEMLINTEVKTIHFGEEVTKLPTNFNNLNSEFYEMGVEEVIFDGLEVVPQKAFLDCKNLKVVDFSQDKNLKEIQELAFYGAENLSEIKFGNNNADITLGYSAVRNTGLTSIGGVNSDFDLTSNHFITNDQFVFSENAQLRKVEIPNDFNNGVVEGFTFWNCKNLKSASIGNKIETIKSYAFCGDEKLAKLFLWGDTVVEQDLSTYEPISEVIPININNYSSNENLSFDLIVNGEKALTLTPEDFTLTTKEDEETETEEEIYTYEYTLQNKEQLTFDYPKSIMYIDVTKDEENNCYNVDIRDINPANFSIPSNTDLYTYSSYDVKSWDETYEDMRRSEELGTDSTVYFLDEVLHLTSNHPKVKLNEDETDFDKSNLIVYALRRDGIVMESDTWGEYTKHYLRTDDLKFETYDENTDEAEEIIYDYPFNPSEVDVSTENFANINYRIRTTADFIQKKEIDLIYTNDFLEDSTVKTDIEPTMTIVDIVNTGDNLIKLLVIFVISVVGVILGTKKLKELK